MKKTLLLLLTAALLAGACLPASASEAPSIVATNFPCYDLARQL